MPITEQDLELLESYLDEALAERDVESLRTRLAGDAELLASLNQLREERALRRSVFAALEPDAAGLDAFTARVRRATRVQRRRGAWLRPLRYAAAAAACVALGFVGRGLFDRTPGNTGAPVHQVTQQNKAVDLQKVEAYQVTLRDDAGRVVAVQRFESLERAQEFAADLARWQSRNERLAGGRFVVTADRF